MVVQDGPRRVIGDEGESVLVVEDEPLVREVICETLRGAGFTVDEAEDGESALKRLAAGVDLLLTDVRLPGRMDGWDIAQKARQLCPSVKVVYLTGYTPQARRIVPGGRFLAKPFTASEMLAVLRDMTTPP